MAGHWATIIPEQCHHYARFMGGLSLLGANAVFWLLFLFVLFLLVISAIQGHKSQELQKDVEKGIFANNSTRQRRKRRLRIRLAATVLMCLLLSVASVVLECFALFNIEFCQGEDLIQLYWGVWSVLMMGSLIAILGVLVSFFIQISSTVENPSWAVALGTPVLVFAAIGWIFTHLGNHVWGKCMGRNESDDDDEDEKDDESDGPSGVERWFSRAPTIVAQQGDSTSARRLVIDTNAPSLRRSSTF